MTDGLRASGSMTDLASLRRLRTTGLRVVVAVCVGLLLSAAIPATAASASPIDDQRAEAQRELAEESLRLNEEHFRSLIENASDIITVLDGDGTAELEDLFVDPAARGGGTGRALIPHEVRRSRAAGVARIEVTANPHALGFYAAVGFVAGGRVTTEFGAGRRMHLDVARAVRDQARPDSV